MHLFVWDGQEKEQIFYNTNGVLCGSANSYNGNATVYTGIQLGGIAIIKIGEKTVKVTLK